MFVDFVSSESSFVIILFFKYDMKVYEPVSFEIEFRYRMTLKHFLNKVNPVYVSQVKI